MELKAYLTAWSPTYDWYTAVFNHRTILPLNPALPLPKVASFRRKFAQAFVETMRLYIRTDAKSRAWHFRSLFCKFYLLSDRKHEIMTPMYCLLEKYTQITYLIFEKARNNKCRSRYSSLRNLLLIISPIINVESIHTIKIKSIYYISENYTNYLLNFWESTGRDKSWNEWFLTQLILVNRSLISSFVDYSNVNRNRIAHAQTVIRGSL